MPWTWRSLQLRSTLSLRNIPSEVVKAAHQRNSRQVGENLLDFRSNCAQLPGCHTILHTINLQPRQLLAIRHAGQAITSKVFLLPDACWLECIQSAAQCFLCSCVGFKLRETQIAFCACFDAGKQGIP